MHVIVLTPSVKALVIQTPSADLERVGGGGRFKLILKIHIVKLPKIALGPPFPGKQTYSSKPPYPVLLKKNPF